LSKLKGLFRQPEARERLKECKQELRRLLDLFKVCLKIEIQSTSLMLFVAGSGYWFKLVANWTIEEGC
jgi:hypothetical protein